MSKKDFSLDTADALNLPLPTQPPKIAEKTTVLPVSKPLKSPAKPVEKGSMVDSLIFDEKERRRSITIHISIPLIKELDSIAHEKDVSRSILVETLLKKALT